MRGTSRSLPRIFEENAAVWGICIRLQGHETRRRGSSCGGTRRLGSPTSGEPPREREDAGKCPRRSEGVMNGIRHDLGRLRRSGRAGHPEGQRQRAYCSSQDVDFSGAARVPENREGGGKVSFYADEQGGAERASVKRTHLGVSTPPVFEAVTHPHGAHPPAGRWRCCFRCRGWNRGRSRDRHRCLWQGIT